MDLESRESQESSDSNQVSRRDFLKKVGIGAAGLGAASMLPSASALDFESGSGFSFGNQTSTNFELGSSGNLNLQGGDIQDAGAANVDKISVGGDGPAESFSEIGGSKGVADAVVTLEGGTPTAYRSDGTQIEQDGDTGIVLNSAFDHVNSLGGGMVKMSAGTFPISTKPEIHTNTTLAGAGMGTTVFQAQTNRCEITHGESNVENVIIRDFTFQGNNQGERTGVNLASSPTNCHIVRVEALNCGPRDGGFTPAIRHRGGTHNTIRNCRAKNCSSVSIENAGGGHGVVRDCVVLDGNYQTNVGFTHGISMEKSDNAIVANNYVEGPAFGPALNFNNCGESLVADNIVKNVQQGIRNANGSDTANSITGNVIIDTSGTGINVKAGGSGKPQSHLIANNTLQNSGIGLEDGKPTVADNVLINSGLGVSPQHMCSITGNQFLEPSGDKIVNVNNRSGTDERVVFANNFFEKADGGKPNDPTIRIKHPYGMCVNNSFNYSAGPDSKKPLLQINPNNSGYWRVTNNYFRHANSPRGAGLAIGVDGLVTGNQFDGCRVQGIYDGSQNPPAAETRFNYGTNGAYLMLPDIGGQTSNNPLFSESWSLSFSYTGDGTTGRAIGIAMAPEYIVVEGSDGTMYDVHRQFGTGYMHNAPSGELSITDMGFTVGDNSADADPNTNGETYTFYAR